MRPITQGVPRISFGTPTAFTVLAITDSVEVGWPEQELPGITQEIGRIGFGTDTPFSIRALSERLVIDHVIQSYTVSTEINPLEYDESIVRISGGAFTMDELTRTFTSTAQAVDMGTLQEVVVSTGEFASVSSQEVST